MDSPLALARLLQVADSGFPTGAYAYSHGIEWFARELAPGEAELAGIALAYVRDVLARQSLPAALAAYRAPSSRARARIDEALDASIAPAAEREAGRATGARLLAAATDAFGPRTVPGASQHLALVRAKAAPGQHAAAFGTVASGLGVSPAAALTALAIGATNALVQAAVRLNLIGQNAAGRILASAGQEVAVCVPRIVTAPWGRRFGAAAPGLETAAILQPTLTFRMFAS
jgi:urease accessory protein